MSDDPSERQEVFQLSNFVQKRDECAEKKGMTKKSRRLQIETILQWKLDD